MISLSFLSEFNVYDVARLDCREIWAGEPLFGAANFAGGQGPGLWARGGHSGAVPQPIAGSEAYRIYALGAFNKANGDGSFTEQLIGIGILTQDMFDWGAANGVTLPNLWRQYTPEHLYLFVSTDGMAWTHHALGNIEQNAGPYTNATVAANTRPNAARAYLGTILGSWMRPPLQWQRGLSAAGRPVLFCYTANHRIEWDGTSVEAIFIDPGNISIGRDDTNNDIFVRGTVNSAVRHPAGIDYLLRDLGGAEFLGAPPGQTGGVWRSGTASGLLHVKGHDVVYSIEYDEDDFLVMNRIRAKNRHAPLFYYNGLPVSGGSGTEVDGMVITTSLTIGYFQGPEHRALGAVNGLWVALFIESGAAQNEYGETYYVPDETAFWMTTFPELPPAQTASGDVAYIVIDLEGETHLKGGALWGDTHLPLLGNSTLQIRGAQGVRGAGGKAYAFRRDCFLQNDGDTTRATIAVFECPANPSAGDFANTCALRGPDGENLYLGTREGYLYLLNQRSGVVSVLARLEGTVQVLALSGTQVFALTANGVWWAEDGLLFQKLRTPPLGFTTRSMALAFDNLFVSESDGSDSRIARFDLTPPPVTGLTMPQLLGVDEYPNLELTTGIVHGGAVWFFSHSPSGTRVRYSDGTTAAQANIAALAGESITALFSENNSKLWLGTGDGSLYLLDGTGEPPTCTNRAETGQGVHALAMINGFLLIATGQAQPGRFYSYEIAADTLAAHDLAACDNSGRGPDNACAPSGWGFVTDGAVPLVLTGCGTVPWQPPLPPGDPPGPDDPPPYTPPYPPPYPPYPPGDPEPPNPPGGLWVSKPLTHDELIDHVQCVITLADGQDPARLDEFLVFCRADSQALPGDFLPSYEQIFPLEETRLQRPGTTLRFLVVPPPGVVATSYEFLRFAREE